MTVRAAFNPDWFSVSCKSPVAIPEILFDSCLFTSVQVGVFPYLPDDNGFVKDHMVESLLVLDLILPQQESFDRL